jgi:hypothetical protein
MPAPIIRHCIVCEDVRFERRNLISLMGIYAPAPEVLIKLRKFEIPTRLCFAFYGTAGSGKFVFEAELRGPAGKLPSVSIPPRLELTLEADQGPTFFAFWFSDVIFPKPNKYTIAVRIDAQECYTNTIQLVQAASHEIF